jgi:RNA polymerase sigma-70 factor (ECF subfamily)
LPAVPAGDDPKVRAFLSRFLQAERRIFAYIVTLLPHRADAEDVLQEASVVMWEKFDEQAPPEDFVAWGCRIAYFRVQQHRRGGRRRRQALFSEAMLERLAETSLGEGAALELEERDEALAHCLDKLGRRDRVLLDERYREGATTQSTADRLGRSANVVYRSLAKIRRALHDCIERRLDAEGRS